MTDSESSAARNRDTDGPSPTSRLEHVWTPLEIGPTRVKHRVMYTAQTLLYGENHLLSDRHIAFYRERAKGGTALMVTEQQAGHPLSKGSFYPGCTAHDKRAVPIFARLADAVHEYGAKQFVQLFGAGVHDKGTMVFDEWHPLWAPSRVTSIVHREVPMVMGPDEIADVARAFGESALNVKVAGLDGVEIHGAHSYLIGQFLSPAYNKRDDAYGGSVRNRCRFAIEVAEAVRGQVGGDITVGIRLSYDEFMGSSGITGEQTEETVALLLETGLFDYFSISCAGYHTLHRTAPPMHYPEAFLEDAGKRIKNVVGTKSKVFLIGRVLDVERADRLVADGATDMVGMTRAQLADPFLVQKAREDRAGDTVRCIGANICVAHAFDQRPSPCVMNPAAGRENQLGSDTLKRVSDNGARRILVVGGGPAGMRLAATAAARGHVVRLAEADPELGGHISLMARLPTRAGWLDAIENLARPVEQSGVEVLVGERITQTSAEVLDADVVVCATGSEFVKTGIFSPYHPDRDRIPGAERDFVWDAGSATLAMLDDPRSLGSSVLIYDETGTYLPLGLAELCAQAGSTVEVMTPHRAVGEDAIRSMDWEHIAPRLADHGVTLTAQHTIDEIGAGRASVRGVYGGPGSAREADAIVLTYPKVPRDRIMAELEDRISSSQRSAELLLLGDALAPRRLEAVIYEAEMLARDL